MVNMVDITVQIIEGYQKPLPKFKAQEKLTDMEIHSWYHMAISTI